MIAHEDGLLFGRELDHAGLVALVEGREDSAKGSEVGVTAYARLRRRRPSRARCGRNWFAVISRADYFRTRGTEGAEGAGTEEAEIADYTEERSNGRTPFRNTKRTLLLLLLCGSVTSPVACFRSRLRIPLSAISPSATRSPTLIAPGCTTLALMPRRCSSMPTGELTKLNASLPNRAANFEQPVCG